MGRFFTMCTKVLGLLVCVCGLTAYVANAQEALDAQGFPADWQTEDFAFTMLEPAAGGISVRQILPIVPATRPAVEDLGLTQPVKKAVGIQSWRVDQMPRLQVTPSGTRVIPATGNGTPASLAPAILAPDLVQGLANPTMGQATDGLYGQAQGATGQMGGQTGGQTGGGTMAADLGIIVSEQPTSGKQGGLAGLSAFGPLTVSLGIADSVWLNANAATHAQRLQAATKQPLQSAALREAFRRLLLANVAAPAAVADSPHWLVVRAEALEKLGLYEAAWSLWREAGPLLRQPGTPPAMLQGWARASLLAGQTDAACALVREQAAAGLVSDFWPTAAAVCAAAELKNTNNPAALSLAIQLLPARILTDEPALVAALNAVRDNVPMVPNNRRNKALAVGSLAGATLAAVPSILTTPTLSLLPDVALRRLRESPSLTPTFRQTAARQLAAQTAWPTDGGHWLTSISSPTALAQPLAAWPDVAIVAWAQQVVSGTAQRAPVGPAAAVVAPAALRLQEVAVAQRWWPAYAELEDLTPSQLRGRAQHHLLLQLALGQNTTQSLSVWLAARGAEAVENRRVLAIVEGMGQPVPASTWAAVAKEATEQDDALNLAWQRLLENAAATQDTPAVLSMIAEALRGQGAGGASPAVLKASLVALRQVGLTDVAQRLGAEALTQTMPVAAGKILRMDNAQPVTPLINTPSVPRPRVPTAPKAPLLPKPQV